MPEGTLRAILKQANVDVEDFLNINWNARWQPSKYQPGYVQIIKY